ncbi:MAG: hypothetical protein QM667_07790 [Asticcacaulis sp.]
MRIKSGILTTYLAACVAFGAALCLASPAMAASAEERKVEITRALEGINSPDPATRLATLEDVAASKDSNLRRLVLTTAFASSDETLRGVALNVAMRYTRSFVVSFRELNKKSPSALFQSTNGQFDVYVQGFDADSGGFLVYNNFSAKEDNRYVAGPGTVAGDRLSANVNMAFAGSLNCMIVARLNKGTALLTGTMACGNSNQGTEYAVEIQILR